MTKQAEQVLEDNLIKQLVGLGYSSVSIVDEKDLEANLKTQLEKHNKTTFSDNEFKKILNHLSKGDIYQKSKTLRDRFQLTKDDGKSSYIEFLNTEHWCQNQFQVTNQVTIDGVYKNRYDVTVLINGLPLVQIELKKRGLELKEAFNQIVRYQKHSFNASKGLYNYVQLFVVSNGVNTKYFANNRKLNFVQTFYWADENNNKITDLHKFADNFLEPCHVSKMIAKYIVLAETDRILMALRPYQYYATEKIVNQVKDTNQNGYIWHTTGSGKTLTSFKTSQLLTKLLKVDKVMFVVDRRDLDYQTSKEFNNFSKGSVDSTDNTSQLVSQLKGDNKLIVTTIQKLNNAIQKPRYRKQLEHLQDKNVVFIFDECHRSQFGDTHANIIQFFKKAQLFGFTGTPIFAKNAVSVKSKGKGSSVKKTTKDLFGECLHKYVITDAIKDENVLKFSIEYVGKYKKNSEQSSLNFVDIEVEDINTKEVLESEKRINKIVDYIVANHNKKTHQKAFTGMLCVGSVDGLIKYYNRLRELKNEGKHNLKVATIFSFTQNEEENEVEVDTEDLSKIEELESNPNIARDPQGGYYVKHTREILDDYIKDYNQMFHTNYSTNDSKEFYKYYNDIAKRVKDKEVDVLLVVNMFLTGFDSKTLNTLYVDKNLNYHGLIQAYSRTNRILNEVKTKGNVVAFRNLKKNTDDAITLFSDKDAKDVIISPPYDDQLKKFKEALAEMKELTPSVESVDSLESEHQEFLFVKAFRKLLRLQSNVSTYSDFSFDDLNISEQEFADYTSKYFDLHDKVKRDNKREKDSILDDIDFELELVHRDEINVTYILGLLAKLQQESILDPVAKKNYNKQKKEIIDLLNTDTQLRSKRELIEKFINEQLVKLPENSDIEDAFDSYWTEERVKAFDAICEVEHLDPSKFQGVIDEYLYTHRPIERDSVIKALETKPKLLERKTIASRIIDKIEDFVDIFINGMTA